MMESHFGNVQIVNINGVDSNFFLMLKSLWRIWAKALGEKASIDNCEADRVAVIRTIVILCYIITNIFIVAGVIRHW